MKLLQLNCWSGKLGLQIKRLKEQENPDFVCLQEAYNIAARPGSMFTSPPELFPPDEYPHSVFGKVFSVRYQAELADFGNIILSKQTMTEDNIIYTYGEPFDDLEVLNGDDYNVRNFLHARYEINGKPLHVLTHHGHHDPHSKDGSPENTRQMQIIADYINLLSGSVILAGDFNLHPQSASLKPINKILTDLPTKHRITSTRTEHAKREEVIDYIFVTKDIIVNDFYASDIVASDHKALLLDFDL